MENGVLTAIPIAAAMFSLNTPSRIWCDHARQTQSNPLPNASYLYRMAASPFGRLEGLPKDDHGKRIVN